VLRKSGFHHFAVQKYFLFWLHPGVSGIGFQNSSPLFFILVFFTGRDGTISKANQRSQIICIVFLAFAASMPQSWQKRISFLCRAEL